MLSIFIVVTVIVSTYFVSPIFARDGWMRLALLVVVGMISVVLEWFVWRWVVREGKKAAI